MNCPGLYLNLFFPRFRCSVFVSVFSLVVFCSFVVILSIFVYSFFLFVINFYKIVFVSFLL